MGWESYNLKMDKDMKANGQKTKKMVMGSINGRMDVIIKAHMLKEKETGKEKWSIKTDKFIKAVGRMEKNMEGANIDQEKKSLLANGIEAN